MGLGAPTMLRIGFCQEALLPPGFDLVGVVLGFWGQQLPVASQGGWVRLPSAPCIDPYAAIVPYAESNPRYIEIPAWVPTAILQDLIEAYPSISWVRALHIEAISNQILGEAFTSLQHPGCAAYKITATPKNAIETLCLMRFLYSHAHQWPLSVYGLGEEGRNSQICLPVLGAAFQEVDCAHIDQGLDYATWQKARGSELNRQTQLYALVGDPVEHSQGDSFHNAIFAQKNINALYLKQRVHPEQARAVLQAMQALPFVGLSVTMPLKEILAPTDDRIGAVNTLKRTAHGWSYTHTDGIAVVDVLQAHGSLVGKPVILLGAGGAARAIAYALVAAGADLRIVNRSHQKAAALADAVGARVGEYGQPDPTLYTALVNTIPDLDEAPAVLSGLKIIAGAPVINIVYMQSSVELANFIAAQEGLFIDGAAVFVSQALYQQAFWAI